MMNKQTEALRLAIEALKGKTDKAQAIQACREALEQEALNLSCKSVQKRLATQWGYVAQPAQEPVTRAQQVIRANNSAQEPVAYMNNDGLMGLYKHSDTSIPLYTNPAPSCNCKDKK